MITGARRGEIAGLKWESINFEKKTIHIKNTILYNSDVGVYETTPKTAESDRVIAIPKFTVDLLKRYREWQKDQISYFAGYYIDRGYVFARDDGQPIHPDSITHYFSVFSKKYGLKHCNPHAFRHTMASILFEEGADEVSVSERLGHAQVSTTANVYAHMLAKSDLRNAEILEDIFKE